MARISLIWVVLMTLFLRVPSAHAETVSTKAGIHHPVIQGLMVVDPKRWPVQLRVSSTGPVAEASEIEKGYGTSIEAIRKGNMGMTIAQCGNDRLHIPRGATVQQILDARASGGLWIDCADNRKEQRLILIAGSTIEIVPNRIESPTTTKLEVAERLAACTTADCATKVAESVHAVIPVIPDPMPFARAEIYRLEAEKNALQLERSDARIRAQQHRSEVLHWAAVTGFALCIIAFLAALLWRKADEVRALRKDQLYTRARLEAVVRDRDSFRALVKAGEDAYVSMQARYDARIVEMNNEHRQHHQRTVSEHENVLRVEREEDNAFLNELLVVLSGVERDLSNFRMVIKARQSIRNKFDKRNLEIASVSDSLRQVIIGEDRMRSYSYQPFDQRSNTAMVSLLTELKMSLARCLNVNPESVSLVWLVQEVTKQLESGVPSPQAELPPTTLRVPNIRRDAKYEGSEGTTLKPLPTGVAPAPGGQVVPLLRSGSVDHTTIIEEEKLSDLEQALTACQSTGKRFRVQSPEQLALVFRLVSQFKDIRFECGDGGERTFLVSMSDLVNPAVANIVSPCATAG